MVEDSLWTPFNGTDLVERTVSPCLQVGIPVQTAKRGDVVIFRYPLDPGRDYVKRCVAVGGDTIEDEWAIICQRRSWKSRT